MASDATRPERADASGAMEANFMFNTATVTGHWHAAVATRSVARGEGASAIVASLRRAAKAAHWQAADHDGIYVTRMGRPTRSRPWP